MGSPTKVASRYHSSEPVFGAVAGGVIQDALLHMARENEQHLRELCEEAGCFKETQIVEFVFLLSEKWSLTESARYQAIEIFERFMLTLIKEASHLTRAKEEDSKWVSVKQQIEGTYVLRLVSCIQLASKLSFHYSGEVSASERRSHAIGCRSHWGKHFPPESRGLESGYGIPQRHHRHRSARHY
ncbi:Hypothetical predicted protein [Podarcis lilfordi]|uniref:Uncharacterized protein n=1 Tax=Podarcis lilfordi TaxID=74358 RepID=A0AA35PM69_9SAUR|nr:Hypothetical predicted protein [Podarcis lilfordi]